MDAIKTLERIGFTRECTGGNCTAYSYRSAGGEILITKQSDSLAPETDEPVTVSLYTLNGRMSQSCDYATLTEAIRESFPDHEEPCLLDGGKTNKVSLSRSPRG